MLKLFCIPGRILAKIFSREKRRIYRSIRSKPSYGPGIVAVSLICWLALAGGILFAIDKSGLLKQALDAGVEVAQGAGDGEEPDNSTGSAEESSSPASLDSARGGLSSSGQKPAEAQTSPIPTNSSEPWPTGPEATVGVAAEQWLVILHTIPKSARDEAERRKARYIQQGLNVDILDTDAFPRLAAGYWIIAQGPFEDRDKALAASNIAKKFESGLMVRRGL